MVGWLDETAEADTAQSPPKTKQNNGQHASWTQREQQQQQQQQENEDDSKRRRERKLTNEMQTSTLETNIIGRISIGFPARQ